MYVLVYTRMQIQIVVLFTQGVATPEEQGMGVKAGGTEDVYINGAGTIASTMLTAVVIGFVGHLKSRAAYIYMVRRSCNGLRSAPCRRRGAVRNAVSSIRHACVPTR